MSPSVPSLPEAVLVAGPNGSGKSTAVDGYIRQRFASVPYLNADVLVRAWREAGDQGPGAELTLRAAREVDARIEGHVTRGSPLVVETVLSSGKYRDVINRARRCGLVFRLVYVTTVDSVVNVERVRQRVASGGHDVPHDKIGTRWERSMAELPWFAARADRLLVLDNSGTEPVVLALRQLGGALVFTGKMPEHPAVVRLKALEGTPAAPARGLTP